MIVVVGLLHFIVLLLPLLLLDYLCIIIGLFLVYNILYCFSFIMIV